MRSRLFSPCCLVDNFHSSIIGPSLPRAINLISGQTHGARPLNISKIVANGTLIGDIDSIYDECSMHNKTIFMTGRNIGNLMNEKGITWGWFEGGFKDGFSGLKTAYI